MYRDPRIRVSDADREAIVARLNAATAEGRLNVDEFSYRAQRAYASRTWGELSRLVDDLPPAPLVVQPVAVPRRSALAVSRLPMLALIFGALSVPLVACFPLGSVSAVAGIVLGSLGLRTSQRVTATAGLALGVLGVLLQLAVWAFIGSVGIDEPPPPPSPG
ncbi:DUF1707 domain-containing protein [Actinoplanes sp. NPDC024001]|uniref:DUF1707 SHOCT-like domain-containing protein n=1 Tax=Actinoplanes sp. NPDC024001 TaxID=3154598 RepID=UPI0033CFECF8